MVGNVDCQFHLCRVDRYVKTKAFNSLCHAFHVRTVIAMLILGETGFMLAIGMIPGIA